MAIMSFNTSARAGTGNVQLFNGSFYILVLRTGPEEGDGYEIGFQHMADALDVKAAAKTMAPALADEIDAVLP